MCILPVDLQRPCPAPSNIVSSMFQVQHTIISNDVATFRFACDLLRCKGACCVVGDAGAPVKQSEIPILNKAWEQLNGALRDRAREVVAAQGLIQNGATAPELNCTDGAECVFVTYDRNGIAGCAIHQAWAEGRFGWIKPLSCHLFPVRIMSVGDTDYLNLEYVPSLCSPACEKGASQGIYLSDYLQEPLTRAYGAEWYRLFKAACREVRAREEAQQ